VRRVGRVRKAVNAVVELAVCVARMNQVAAKNDSVAGLELQGNGRRVGLRRNGTPNAAGPQASLLISTILAKIPPKFAWQTLMRRTRSSQNQHKNMQRTIAALKVA